VNIVSGLTRSYQSNHKVGNQDEVFLFEWTYSRQPIKSYNWNAEKKYFTISMLNSIVL